MSMCFHIHHLHQFILAYNGFILIFHSNYIHIMSETAAVNAKLTYNNSSQNQHILISLSSICRCAMCQVAFTALHHCQTE